MVSTKIASAAARRFGEFWLRAQRATTSRSYLSQMQKVMSSATALLVAYF
jgi:hypothetical protein